MSTLVINGCSYTINWRADMLNRRLGFDNAVNLSIAGSSNDSIIRRTTEYILNNNNVGIVILALTFWDRQEAPWDKTNKWTDYSIHGVMRPDEVDDPDFYKPYIKERFKYDVAPLYFEKLIDTIILFSGWLENQNIDYLIFSSTSTPRLDQLPILKSKVDVIRTNKNIIDIDHWCANQYLFDNGGTWIEADSNLLPWDRHYTSESYIILNDFIEKYLNDK